MISVIIPAFNEENTIRQTVAYVFANAAYKRFLKEVIVVDGGSTDGTVNEAQKTGATIMISPRKGRAAQLNYGAGQASGQILYFLQPHSLPPENFISEIVKAHSKGYAGGTFSLKFDYRHWLLNTLSWFTNNASWVYLCDQSLFVTKELFHKAGGFREDHLVMVNQEMVQRVKRYTNFIVLKDQIVSSAQKYVRTGIFKTEVTQALVYAMHKLGSRQQLMAKLYRKLLKWEVGPATHKMQAPDKKVEETSTEQIKKKIPVLSQ